jgi:hypothetical protein
MWWNNLRRNSRFDPMSLAPWAYFDARYGVTSVDASMKSPNNISVIWNQSRLSVVTADTMTDEVSTGYHGIGQSPTNIVWIHPMTISWEAKAGTVGYMWILEGNTIFHADVNLVNGAIIATTGCTCTSIALTDGWFRYTLIAPASAATGLLWFYMYKTIGNHQYLGNGAGTCQVRNFTITQQNISQWADLSGNGRHAKQGTSGARPVYNQSSSLYQGRSSINLTASGTGLFLDAAVLPQPLSVVCVGNSSSASAIRTFWAGAVVSGIAVYTDNSGNTYLDGSGGTSLNTAKNTNVPSIVTSVFNSNSSLMKILGKGAGAGGLRSGNGGNVGISRLIIGALSTAFASQLGGEMYSMLVIPRSVTTGEIHKIENYYSSLFPQLFQ